MKKSLLLFALFIPGLAAQTPPQVVPPTQTPYVNFTQGIQFNGNFGIAGSCAVSTGSGTAWANCATGGIPGLTGDGLVPPGIVVLGNVAANSGSLAADPPGGPATALHVATQHYADTATWFNARGFGCVPNSTAPADMTANVTCLQNMGNTFGRYYLPTGTYNLNACASFTNFGGFIFEGAGVNGTYILQNTDNTCAMQFVTSFFPNEFRISDMTIGHVRAQTPPHDLTVNSAAPAIFLSGPSGASIFNYEFSRLAFTKSSRGIEIDHTIGGTSWGYDINGIRGNNDLQGAVINLCGTNAGNPRIHLQRIFAAAPLTTEPAICIVQGQEVGVDDIEYTPQGSFYSTPAATSFSISGNVTNVIATNTLAVGQKVAFHGFTAGTYFNNTDATVTGVTVPNPLLPATAYQFAFTHADVASTADAGIATVEPFPTALQLGGSSTGKVSNVHIESYTEAQSGAALIGGENSELGYEAISAAVLLCPAPYPCNSSSSVNMYLLSNIAGLGNISLKNFTLDAPYLGGNPNGALYGMRYNANGDYAECLGMRTDFIPATYSIGCIDPNSDLARATRNGNQYAVVASAPAASSWAITSVATSSGGAAVYTGTFTGCVSTATERIAVTGFVTTPANNGFFRLKNCSSTSLTLINGAAVAETHAGTAVSAVSAVGLPFWGRLWNGASSQTVSCTPALQPMLNPTTSLWDPYFLTSCSGLQTNSQPWTRNSGWLEIATVPGANTQDVTAQAPGNSGFWNFGGMAPGDTFGARPTARGYSNVGGVFTATDYRSEIDGGGHALGTVCMASNTSFTKGAENMPALQQCQAMFGYDATWYSGTLANIVKPAQVVTTHGAGTDTAYQLSDTTGTSGTLPKFNAAGGLTNSGVAATSIAPLYNTSGTIQASAHHVNYSQALAGGTATVTLSGAAVFTNSSSYACSANDGTAAAAVKVAYVSGSSFTLTGTGTDAVSGTCTGN